MAEWSPCYKSVICKECKRKYECTPEDDYFNSTCSTDGVCFSCLMEANRAAFLSGNHPGMQ